VTTTPPTAFQAAHGGSTNPYAQAYSLGRGVAGNPDLKPETSRSFTLGSIYEPTRWLSFTADYYNVKKSDLITSGPDIGKATAAYYAGANQAAGCAAVAAVGPGYSCNVVDAPDPLFPAALPRVLIINVPYVNANYSITTGIDLGHRQVQPDRRHQADQPPRSHPRDQVRPAHRYGDPEVRRHPGPERPVVGQRYAGLARQLAEHPGLRRKVHAVGHGLLRRQDQVGGSDQRTDVTCATGNQYNTAATRRSVKSSVTSRSSSTST
jgi:iron complex outermembrane receptor protein